MSAMRFLSELVGVDMESKMPDDACHQQAAYNRFGALRTAVVDDNRRKT